MTNFNLHKLVRVAACVVLLALAACESRENLAEGLGYTLLPGPSREYPDTDGTLLTDGVYASQDNVSKGWLGFDQGDPTVTFDLDRVCRVDRVEASFLSCPDFSIELPTTVDLSVSQDGDRWIATGELSAPAEGSNVFFIETPGLRVRYVRLTIERSKWVLLDEVRVLGAVSRSSSVPVLTGNLARGLRYGINVAPSHEYPDVTGTVLTDGKFADEDDLYTGWVAFDDNRPIVTFDLETVCEIDRLAASFLVSDEFGISLPVSVELFVSQDGQRWISSGLLTPSEEDPSVFVIDTPELRVRYVRLVMERVNWLFVDEIQIFGSIAPALRPMVPAVSGNVATRVAYLLDPPPNAEYPDVQDMTLTDGKHASPDDPKQGWVGFDHGEPTITMDLEAVCRINTVRASFLAAAEAGAALPRAVRLMFSLDGERWFLGGRLAASAAAASQFRLEMVELRARYLRLEIKSDQWTLVDEIEVFGSLTPIFFTYLPIEMRDAWAELPGPDDLLGRQIYLLSQGY